MKLIVKVTCFLVGGLFIFSGLIKAVDPLGFSYKLNEYFEYFEMAWMTPLSLILAIGLCALEILLGFALIVRHDLKIYSWLLLGIIIFFTFLTGFAAIVIEINNTLPSDAQKYQEIRDCGCFGDAIPLEPFQSFMKDVILLVLSLLIFIRRRTIEPLIISPSNRQAIVFGSGVLSVALSIYCLRHLPVKDFRAYKVGANILEKMTDGYPPVVETKMILKNKETGEQREVNTEQYMQLFKEYPQNFSEIWEMTDRKDVTIKEGKEASIHDFSLDDPETGENITEQVIGDPRYNFMIVAYNLENSSEKGFKEISELRKSFADDPNVNFYMLTSSPENVIEDVKKNYDFDVTTYRIDETALKTIIRSNPGILLIKNGVVLGKWHHNDTPDKEELIEDYFK